MANRGKVEFRYNKAVLTAINDRVTQAVAQVFEADIKPMAQELTPVDRGTNRRSITTQTERIDANIVKAEIFTQSGYGGYLELGHRVAVGPRGAGFQAVGEDGEYEMVQGRPYIYPSFVANQQKLLDTVKDGLAELNGKKVL